MMATAFRDPRRPLARRITGRAWTLTALLAVVVGCASTPTDTSDAPNNPQADHRAGNVAEAPYESAEPDTPRQPHRGFTDVAKEAGFTHRHHKPVLDHQLDNIMSWVCSVGAAVAAGDYNNDGWIDLYVTDSKKNQPNYLYRNNGDGTFTDVAKKAGVAHINDDTGTSMDCIWGDVDNDGWADLYVVKWGNDHLFHNNGDGTFTDVTQERFRTRDGSPGTTWANGNAAIFFDFNLDGRLDIYVGNYFKEVDLWHLDSTRIMHDDFEKARNGGENFLYRQEPDGTFSEVGSALGVNDPGWTLAVGSGDLNNDGWPDLYCADDFGPDQLFLNKRDGTFANVSDEAIGFDSKKGMNVDVGDFNNDGWLDIYVTNITTAEYLQEGNMLWHNNGPDPLAGVEGGVTFTDISLETGTYDGGWGWGGKFLDYDNDGDLDILALNGFISAGEGNYWYDLASWTVTGEDAADAKNWPTIGDRSFSGYEPYRFWQNDGFYTFSERAEELGIQSRHDGRGMAVFDYDHDGDLDIFVANQDQPPHLYRNDLVSDSHWLIVRLKTDPATNVNRDGIGTRVTAVLSDGRIIRERDGGNGYSGQSDPRLHFGFGKEASVRLLEVRWPDGGLQYEENVAADRMITITQDPSRYASQVATSTKLPKRWNRNDDTEKPAPPKIDPDTLEKLLADMEAGLREALDSYTMASRYRATCAEHDQHDRAIEFFKEMVDDDPGHWRARVELACAYVDKIPTCGGLAAIVSKGTLARKSLDQLDAVIKENPGLWVGYYTRGMNHLHWPRALLHSADAAKDFARCAEIQERSAPLPMPDHYLRTYIAWGDALAKDGKYDPARRAWKRGLDHFPGAEALQARLRLKQDSDLLAYVEDQRTLEAAIDTNLAFLDSEQ